MGVSGVEDVIAKFGEPKAVDRFSAYSAEREHRFW